MVKLRTGPGVCHMKMSQGPPTNKYHFYNTRYASEYGIDRKEFTPRTGRHTGTGYSSNFRPQLYYSRSQDNLDNPAIGFLLSDNYEAVTKQHYQGFTHPPIAIPDSLTGAKDSGFVREKPLTVPRVLDASSVFYNTKHYGGKSFPGIPPKHMPVLHKLRRHDPTEEENSHKGPQYMTSEVKAKFRDSAAQWNIHQKDIGALENSGFTDNQQIEPINFKEGRSYGIDDYGQGILPPGNSVMRSSFVSWEDTDGKDFLPRIRARASTETGFIKEQPRRLYTLRRANDAYLNLKDAPHLVHERVKKGDPSEYLNMKHPDNKTSVTTAIYKGQQSADESQEMRLARVHRGNLELSGNAQNNDRYEPTQNHNETRYLTNYNMRYHDKTTRGVDREGWVMGGLQQPKEDGYRRDFKVHSLGKYQDSQTAWLRRLDPYVVKSIKCKDKFLIGGVH